METNIEFLNMIMGMNQSQFKKMDKFTDSVENPYDNGTFLTNLDVLNRFSEYGYDKNMLKGIGAAYYKILFNFAIGCVANEIDMTETEIMLCEYDTPYDGGRFYFNGIEFDTKEQLINLVRDYRKKTKPVVTEDKAILIHLRDDATGYGGKLHMDETLAEFMEEVGLPFGSALEKVNKTLKECGIEPITETELDNAGELRFWDGGYEDDDLDGMEIVTWCESQDLMEMDGYLNHSWLINDELGLDTYGSASYVVEIDWYLAQLGTQTK